MFVRNDNNIMLVVNRVTAQYTDWWADYKTLKIQMLQKINSIVCK